MHPRSGPPESRLALITLGLTFLLLLLGGVVHNTHSSLACPDWPLCNGQVFPVMKGGVLIEHSHRLLASLVGVCTIGLLALLMRRASITGERDLNRLGVGALLLVVLQGVLGGLTVIWRLPTWTSTSHLAVSMLFFLTVLYIALRVRPQTDRAPLSPSVRGLLWVGVGLTYAQIVLGALVRHLGAGLSCIDVPYCGGALWPKGGYQELHMLHRLVGVALFLVLLAVSVATARVARGSARVLAILLPFLVAVQIGLGLLSVTSFLGPMQVTLHLGVAVLILASLWILQLGSRARLGLLLDPEPAHGYQQMPSLP